MNYKILSQLTNEEINNWNDFVEHNNHSHPFQKYDWGQFQRAYRQVTPLYFFGKENEQIQMTGLILEKKIPRTKMALHEIPCGPLFSGLSELGEGLNWLNTHLKENSVALEIWPRWTAAEEKDIKPVLERQGFQPNPDVKRVRYHDETVTLDLRPDLDALFSGFRKSTKWEIHRQEKAGIRVLIENTPHAMDLFYSLYKVHAPKRGSLPLPKKYFDTLFETFLKNNSNGYIALGLLENKPRSAAVFLRTQKRIWYTYGASVPEKKGQLPTSHLMHWKSIQYAKDSGCVTYDFGGAIENIDPKHRLYGVILFKTGFSKKFLRYLPSYRRIYRPALMRLVEGYRWLKSK